MGRWQYPALAFVTGAAVTVYEFAAPTLFRAYFGQTIYIWANVIGVILGALALGYALGGRWADRTTSGLPLVVVLAVAGGYGLLVGWVGPAVCQWIVGPEEYTQDFALRAFTLQSLAASLILFGPPVLALGMATPLMVQRASASWPVGAAAGVVFGVGTVGSIAGIYLTTFVFLQTMGVRATITVAGATLLLLAVLGFFWTRRTWTGCACLLGLAPFLLGRVGLEPPWASLPGGKIVLAIESPYQLILVRDRPDGARWLMFDEGLDSYHSIKVDGQDPWTGAYYDAFARLPEWIGGDGSIHLCIVGNAAGTMADLLRLHNEETEMVIDGVEIDPKVTEASRREMGLKDHPQNRVFHADGRTFLRGRPKGSYDAILMDAYARQVSIPPGLATKEFFALAKSRLRVGGMILVNLGALRPGGRLVDALCDTMAAGFESPVYRCPLDGLSNVLLVAARGGPPRAPPKSTPLLVAANFGLHRAGDMVLTDDYCPVESLTLDDLLYR